MGQFPYTLQAGFETGATDFDSALTDSQSKTLGYLHYTTAWEKYKVLPWRGAYMWGIDQSVGTKTTDIYQKQAAFDVANASYYCVSANIYLKGNTMGNGDRTSLITCRSAAADQAVVQLYYTTAGGFQLLATQSYDTAVGTNPVCPITENAWHQVEIYGLCSTAGSGTLYLVVDGVAIGNVGSLTHVAMSDLFIGATNADATHTAGLIFYDDVYAHLDTASVRFGLRSRYPMNPHVSALASATYKEHIFVGPGTVRRATLLTQIANDLLRLYDTDTANVTGTYRCVAETVCLDVDATTAPIRGPVAFQRGCLAVITGASATGARAIIEVDPNPPAGFPRALYYGRPGLLASYISRRSVAPGETV
jgi:hypothetical protein